MEDRMSRRAALKVLAAGAVFGCSPEEDGDSGPLAPIVEGGAEPADASDYQGAVSYLATEQLQDIHGDPAPGSIYVYGVKDDVVRFIDGRRVGEDGYFERIPIHDQYSKILLAGVISSGVTAVTNVVSFTPLIDFSQDEEFVGPLRFKVLRKDQIPEGFDPSLFTNYLQNLDPVGEDGLGVTHAFQFSVKDGMVTDVSGTYLRPFMPEIRDQFKLFIPEISFKGFPLADLGEREHVVTMLARNLRKFVPNLEVVVGKIGRTGGVRLNAEGVYEIDPGYFLISLERQQWQQPDGSSIIPIETAIESEFQGELRGAFGSIFMTKRLSVDLLDRILAKAAARCVGLTGTAPMAVPPHLTILTHGRFYRESPDEVGEAEIMAFKLANAYPARPGNDRRRPIEVLGDALPTEGQSVTTLWGGAAAGVSAPSRGTIGSGSARVAPVPVRTNAHGSYGLAARDLATCLEQNFEAAGPLISARRD